MPSNNGFFLSDRTTKQSAGTNKDSTRANKSERIWQKSRQWKWKNASSLKRKIMKKMKPQNSHSFYQFQIRLVLNQAFLYPKQAPGWFGGIILDYHAPNPGSIPHSPILFSRSRWSRAIILTRISVRFNSRNLYRISQPLFAFEFEKSKQKNLIYFPIRMAKQ